MNRGILYKSFRETVWITLVFGVGLAALEAMLTGVIPVVFKEIPTQWLEVVFVQNMLRGLLGTDVGGVLGPTVIAAIPWVHPIALAMVWALEISLCTRLPAGEIDRGTIDILLSFPVSRIGIYLSETLVWLGAGAVVIALGLAGNTLGTWIAGPAWRVAPSLLLMMAGNLFCLYVAVGGVACLVSSMSDRRGRAVGVVFAIVLASFLLNFLAQFWDPARRLSFLSVLSYHRPMVILRDGGWPVRDMVVLLSVGAACAAAGAAVFVRRDIRTV
jgi:ABC-2 type transport system permease protein